MRDNPYQAPTPIDTRAARGLLVWVLTGACVVLAVFSALGSAVCLARVLFHPDVRWRQPSVAIPVVAWPVAGLLAWVIAAWAAWTRRWRIATISMVVGIIVFAVCALAPLPGQMTAERHDSRAPSTSTDFSSNSTNTMSRQVKGRATRRGRRSYMELVAAFPLASVKSDAQLVKAQRVMDRLVAKGKLDDGELMYLDALSDLAAAYEDVHHPIEPASDADMLRHLLEAKGMSQGQLSDETGLAKSTVSEVLKGKRKFSRRMIRKLADYFHVDVSVLAANL